MVWPAAAPRTSSRRTACRKQVCAWSAGWLAVHASPGVAAGPSPAAAACSVASSKSPSAPSPPLPLPLRLGLDRASCGSGGSCAAPPPAAPPPPPPLSSACRPAAALVRIFSSVACVRFSRRRRRCSARAATWASMVGRCSVVWLPHRPSRHSRHSRAMRNQADSPFLRRAKRAGGHR